VDTMRAAITSGVKRTRAPEDKRRSFSDVKSETLLRESAAKDLLERRRRTEVCSQASTLSR
jgi:hypothetical protein